MADDELAGLDATAQAALVRSGAASPEELVEAAIARIERVDPALNAVIVERFDAAQAEARGALPDGPFRGVPYLVKDLGPGGQVSGLPSHRGNAALRDAGFVFAAADSHVVRRVRRAGFVIVGKTNTPELGLAATTEPVAYGPTRNPWDTTRTPAGSSGGSAAAVAAGLVPVAGASDGGGSIRMPAAACGLVGLKVSRGRVSAGPHAAGDGRSVEHCLTRTVRDTAAVLDVLAGPETGDPVIAPAPERPFRAALDGPGPRLRVAVEVTSPLGTPVDDDVARAVRATADALADLGHEVRDGGVDAIRDAEVGLAAIYPLHAASIAASVDAVGRDLGRPVGPDDFEPGTWAHAETGRAFDGVQLLVAQDQVVAWTRRVGAFFADTDVLLTPTLATVAPPLGTLTGTTPEHVLRQAEFGPFCAAWNWTGQPAISLPLGTDRQGLPVGVQLVAGYGREDVLVRVAARLEEVRPWRDRRPAVHA